MFFQNTGNAIAVAFQNLAAGVITYVPNIIAAVILVVVGWVLGDAIGLWISKLIRALRIDRVLEKIDLHKLMQQAGYRLDTGKFLGVLVKWFIILGFIVAALNVLQLNEVSNFLRDILVYIPRVIIATLILIIAAIVADALQKIVAASAKAASISSAELFGGITKWLIWIFALVMALEQLGLVGAFLQIFLTGIVATVSIALGLSFGLGGKEAASNFINKLRSDLGSKEV